MIAHWRKSKAHGALCGVKAKRLTTSISSTTCPACRFVIDVFRRGTVRKGARGGLPALVRMR